MPRHAAQHPEGVIVGVEQHLVCFLQKGPNEEGAAVGELEVRNLQLHALAANHHSVFRPVELEGFARQEGQWNECAAAGGLLLPLPGALPISGERCHVIVRPLIAERHAIGAQLFDGLLLLARLAFFLAKHVRQLIGVGIELAWPIGDLELGLDPVGPQIPANRVPRQASAPRYLADRKMIPMPLALDNAQ